MDKPDTAELRQRLAEIRQTSKEIAELRDKLADAQRASACTWIRPAGGSPGARRPRAGIRGWLARVLRPSSGPDIPPLPREAMPPIPPAMLAVPGQQPAPRAPKPPRGAGQAPPPKAEGRAAWAAVVAITLTAVDGTTVRVTPRPGPDTPPARLTSGALLAAVARGSAPTPFYGRGLVVELDDYMVERVEDLSSADPVIPTNITDSEGGNW